MIPEQTFEGRRESLSQANKLGRTYAVLLDALNRHRGKGQQKVTVEHVHVHPGGQAMVGTVESPGGGDRPKSEDQPHAKQIAHASQPAVCQVTQIREAISGRPSADSKERQDYAAALESVGKYAAQLGLGQAICELAGQGIRPALPAVVGSRMGVRSARYH